MRDYELASLQKHFKKMGATLQVLAGPRAARSYDMNLIENRRQGDEIFSLTINDPDQIEVHVLDVDARDRHLLLMIKSQSADSRFVEKHRYLCGHDERAWFVAAIPDRAFGVTNVVGAKEALKPEQAVVSQRTRRVKRKNRNKRHNKGFLRQGEWFFIPVSNLVVDLSLVLKNEPVRRGSGNKPHVIEEVYRTGGELVYISRRYPEGISEAEYKKVVRRDPKLKRVPWQTMRRNPGVFGRGKVKHLDHATLKLRGWHRVLPNTEAQATFMQRNLTFLD